MNQEHWLGRRLQQPEPQIPRLRPNRAAFGMTKTMREPAFHRELNSISGVAASRLRV